MTRRLRIGGGAGFLDDRIEPALDIVKNGCIDFLILEHLAERTLALLQEAKRSGKAGHVGNLRERMEALLPPASERGVRIVTNLGGADPAGAAASPKRAALGRFRGSQCSIATIKRSTSPQVAKTSR